MIKTIFTVTLTLIGAQAYAQGFQDFRDIACIGQCDGVMEAMPLSFRPRPIAVEPELTPADAFGEADADGWRYSKWGLIPNRYEVDQRWGYRQGQTWIRWTGDGFSSPATLVVMPTYRELLVGSRTTGGYEIPGNTWCTILVQPMPPQSPIDGFSGPWSILSLDAYNTTGKVPMPEMLEAEEAAGAVIPMRSAAWLDVDGKTLSLYGVNWLARRIESQVDNKCVAVVNANPGRFPGG